MSARIDSPPALPATHCGSLVGAAASLKLTVVLLVLLAAAVALSFDQGAPATWTLAAPLAALAINLLAAVATHPTFRRQPALLVFHLGLIAVLLLVGAGRLTYLRGTLELPQGEVFDGQLLSVESGPLHPWRLAQAGFAHDGFEIDYAPGLRRGPTRNPVRWRDDAGRTHRAVIGDHQPLVRLGYRFYTTSNKGFAARVSWRERSGAVQPAILHFPSYPVFAFDQKVEWNLRDHGSMPTFALALELPQLVVAERAATLTLPPTHALTLTVDGASHRLRPGETVRLPSGDLTYEGLGTWMGYRVDYDPTLPWLLAAVLVSVAALSMHFWRRFVARPWRLV